MNQSWTVWWCSVFPVWPHDGQFHFSLPHCIPGRSQLGQMTPGMMSSGTISYRSASGNGL